MNPEPTPDIAILWKSKKDKTQCLLSRRGATLVVSLQHGGKVEKEQTVQSPREAMQIASSWRDSAA